MVDTFIFGRLVILGILALVPVALLILLIVALTRRGGQPSTPPPPAAGPPPPSLDQRTARLERSRSQYAEERSRILGMLENGTIRPEEADRLFATLDRETSTMACPYCGNDVRIEAIRCKHCHRDLVADMQKPRQLRRSRNRMLAGVCGGLADYTSLDPTLLRLLVAFVVLASGIVTGLIIYAVAAMIIPNAE